MGEYRRNKLKTAWEITQRIENWPTAFGMRLRTHQPGLRLLNFRDGLNVACRGATGDWRVVHELLFAGSYRHAFEFLSAKPKAPVVLDLGGNIGLFSLLAARAHPTAQIYAYEPGPPNYRLFEVNCLCNPALAERIHLRKEAVAGRTRTTEWFFDAENPGGSGFFGVKGAKFDVQIRAFSEVIAALPGVVDLAKIDIEGSEFDLLAETPAQTWQKVNAISLELHDDPNGAVSRPDFLARMSKLGYVIEEEDVCTVFMHR